MPMSSARSNALSVIAVLAPLLLFVLLASNGRKLWGGSELPNDLQPSLVPTLGKVVEPDSRTGLSITVFADGVGLPTGSGTAQEGAAVYTQHCQACHGVRGTQGINDRLVGGIGSLATGTPIRTVGSYWPYATTLFDYIRRAMPYPTPGVLSNAQLYAVTAYLLFENGIIEQDERLDADSLPAIAMPNRDGFSPEFQPK